jgi:hypothetical protein
VLPALPQGKEKTPMGKRKTMGNKEELRHEAKGCRTEQISRTDETMPALCPDAPVYQTYKDRVFRMLFKDRKNLLELYNALNGTDYANEDELTVNILENAIFIKMRNDVSFIISGDMCLYEHQSTVCPNMPLRGFLYMSDMYKKLVKDAELCSKKLVKIPVPHYIVFYNGTERKEEEFVQKLSDAFEIAGEGCMELTVRVININLGRNRDLMTRCPSLYGYAYFINAIRQNLDILKNVPEKERLHKAVVDAIDECIEKNILRDFLQEQKAEVIAMSIYEYNEELALKAEYECGEEDGYDRGCQHITRLYGLLSKQGRNEDILKAAGDPEYQQRLLKELNIQ